MNRMIQKGEGSVKTKTHLPVATNRTTTVGAVIGIVISFVMSLILIAGITGLVTGNKLSEGSLVWLVFVVRIVTVMVGALIGTGLAKEKCVITAGIIVAGYSALLLSLGIVIYDEAFQNFGAGLLSVIIGGAIGYLIRLKLQNKPRRGRKIKV